MKHHRLPIWRTLAAAYRELGRLMTAMRSVMLSALLILLAISAVTEFIPDRISAQPLTGEALGLLQSAVEAFLLAPIFIAVHRFVILDEVTGAYALPAGAPVFWRFVGWLFALKVLLGLPLDFLGALQALDISLVASMLAFAVALTVAIAVALRLTILLPALAVERPGATLAYAWADSKGEVLRLLVTFFLALAPLAAVTLARVYLLGRGAMIVGSPSMMVSLLMGGVVQTISLTLTAMIASYAFIALAAHVKRST